jgi:MFS family permease
MSADAHDQPPTTGRRVPRPVSVAVGGLCLLLGSIGAVFVPSLLPIWTVLGGIVGGVVYLATCDRATDGPPPPRRGTVRRAAWAGIATTVVCLALTGAGSILGAASGPVILLLLLAVALWAWRARRQLTRSSVAVADAVVPERSSAVSEPPPDADGLTTPELCRAWQRSYLALIDVPEGPVREDIAAWRRSLLDELERRDPIGFDKWLRDGARAGSDPGRYLDLASDH